MTVKKNIFRKILIIIPLLILLVWIAFGSFYTYWNSAPPSRTCASCHEIEGAVNMFAESYHRNLRCTECHGTAISNGIHSLKEKGSMIVKHAKNENTEDIRLNEDQVLAVTDNCTRCHADEKAKWLSGGHSARYQDIFLNEKHNRTEQLNFDCLRCHGMFADIDINGLVEPLDKKGPWKFKDNKMASHPVIPCLACHQVHTKGSPRMSPNYSNPKDAFYQRKVTNSKVSFYNRQDQTKVPAEDLPKLKLWEGKLPVEVSDDIQMRNCIQCHAPNARHQAGTGDDRTPRGVHEGLSCIDCHELHSNDARHSCSNCHPAVSNCNLDVTKMNTSYFDSKSPNNIHWVACIDCHPERKARKTKNKIVTSKNYRF